MRNVRTFSDHVSIHQSIFMFRKGSMEQSRSITCESPTLRYVRDQIASITQTIRNKEVFSASYEDIVQNIIPAINNQLEMYQKASYKAIKKEIYNEALKAINFDELKMKIKNNFTSKSFPSPAVEELKIPSADTELTFIESSYFDKLYLQLSETDKKYAKAGIEIDEHLNDVLKDLANFERDLCQYRDASIQYLLSKVPYLTNCYELEVLNITQKQPHRETFNLNHKTIVPFPMHLDAFIQGCFDKLI